MACDFPIEGWRAWRPNENGKHEIVFSGSGANRDERVLLPCGRCAGCRLERSKQWALRCVHEASQHSENCFITLTYNDENLPPGETLVPEHWTTFIKQLRQRVRRQDAKARRKARKQKLKLPEFRKLKYYMAGEYGTNQDISTTDMLGRPHYHAILFGYDFHDRELFGKSNTGDLYVSEQLTELWGKGHASLGEVTFASAAYVARYCMKKINGEDSDEFYSRVDKNTGEVFPIVHEYSRMSRRPGIGESWYKRFKYDLVKGYITHNGVKMPYPDYYDKLSEKDLEDGHPLNETKFEKSLNKKDPLDPELMPDRLRVKQKVREIRTKILKRNLT